MARSQPIGQCEETCRFDQPLRRDSRLVCSTCRIAARCASQIFRIKQRPRLSGRQHSREGREGEVAVVPVIAETGSDRGWRASGAGTDPPPSGARCPRAAERRAVAQAVASLVVRYALSRGCRSERLGRSHAQHGVTARRGSPGFTLLRLRRCFIREAFVLLCDPLPSLDCLMVADLLRVSRTSSSISCAPRLSKMARSRAP
jgi:hypothetical protein